MELVMRKKGTSGLLLISGWCLNMIQVIFNKKLTTKKAMVM